MGCSMSSASTGRPSQCDVTAVDDELVDETADVRPESLPPAPAPAFDEEDFDAEDDEPPPPPPPRAAGDDANLECMTCRSWGATLLCAVNPDDLESRVQPEWAYEMERVERVSC